MSNLSIEVAPFHKQLCERLDSLVRRRDEGMFENARYMAYTICALQEAGLDRHHFLTDRLVRRLLELQHAATQSWCSELWDSAWVILALSGYRSPATHDAVQACVSEFINPLWDSRQGNWIEEFLETVVTVRALAALGVEKDCVRQASAWIASVQHPNGSWLSGPYTTGLVIWALSALPADAAPPDLEERLAKASGWLAAAVAEDGSWASTLWQNSIAVVGLLSGPRSRTHHAVIESAMRWFLDLKARELAENREIDEVAAAALALGMFLRRCHSQAPGYIAPDGRCLELEIDDQPEGLVWELRDGGTRVWRSRRAVAREDLDDSLRALEAIGRARNDAGTAPADGSAPGTLPRLLKQLASIISRQLAPEDLNLKESLQSLQGNDVLVVIPSSVLFVPWELMACEGDYLGLRFSVTRNAVASGLPRLENARNRRRRQGGRILLIGNPDGTLPAAATEVGMIRERLQEIIEPKNVASLQNGVSWAEFCEHLESGEIDLLHFAGHCTFDADRPEDNSMVFADRTVPASLLTRWLRGSSLRLAFINGCSSAHAPAQGGTYFEAGVSGLARAFLDAGVGAYVGTLWPVYDEPAARFASDFYALVLSGHALGDAVRIARLRSRDEFGEDDVSWSSFIAYGQPSYRPIDRQS